uniref:Phosphatidylinositol-specific phospholipase C, X domain containing 1 n=1 Tax=Oncorhynchus tshawytscha TaxID=74940 RepID=A0AAZ3SF96_ONCTS
MALGAGRTSGPRCWQDIWPSVLAGHMALGGGRTYGPRCWQDIWPSVVAGHLALGGGRTSGPRWWQDIWPSATVKEQLDCGVRYLDLRIAHRPNDTSTDLYFYHGVYTTLTVETVLQEIRSWLDVHSREVVLLSFSHFLGLNQDLHTGLISTIRTIFNARLCPTTEVVTLRNLWSLGYQVIVSYEHSMVSLYSDLWPHIPYWWANKCKAEALIEEFEHRKQHGRPGGFFVTGINLTEDLKYICSHPTESLKDLVMSTYPALLSWVRGQSPGSESHSLNIIAGDFVSESHFVPTVIALNQHLHDVIELCL